MNIFLTGGSGYIGSHTAVSLVEAGHDVFIYDNLSNSEEVVVTKIETILKKKLVFIEGDICETTKVEQALLKYKIDAVIHFAGLKAVGDSSSNPLLYYKNNVQGSISLLCAMKNVGIKTLVFSSSATVYGEPQYLPYDESHPTSPINPYGNTKLHVEKILKDLAQSDEGWGIVCLRYFNPVGAHESGLIGEDPRGVPNNLMPYIVRVAIGSLPYLSIFGNDYNTKDGTGERDYIHIMDLAEGHVSALNFLKNNKSFHAINLGTGCPISVFELINAFEGETGCKIKWQLTTRREGDLPTYYAKSQKAKELMNWEPKRSLELICSSAFNYQIKNR